MRDPRVGERLWFEDHILNDLIEGEVLVVGVFGDFKAKLDTGEELLFYANGFSHGGRYLRLEQ
jgi:hypothetical protein